MFNDKCPKCGGEIKFLAGEPAHDSNLYCKDQQGCGWEAWDESTHKKPLVDLQDSYSAVELADWLDEQADNEDVSADMWQEGSKEAISDRINAIRFRRCSELIRATAKVKGDE